MYVCMYVYIYIYIYIYIYPFVLKYGAASVGNWVTPFLKTHCPYFHSTNEDKDITFLRNVGIGLPIGAASYTRRKESSYTPLQKPQNYQY